MSEPSECPDCGASFVGKPIPEKYRADYGRDNFRNCVGIVAKDRTVGYICHKCGAVYSRNWQTKYPGVRELINAS